MKFVYWTAAVLFVLTAAPSAFFFALYLGSGEPVPRERAKRLWRWAWLVVLVTFNIWVYRNVVLAIVDFVASRPRG